jgi:hypothetical protein
VDENEFFFAKNTPAKAKLEIHFTYVQVSFTYALFSSSIIFYILIYKENLEH